MSKKKQYDYQRIDRRTAQDDWYLQRRREIVSANNTIQKKSESGGIEISSPGDAHEQQADSIAQKVVNGGDVNLSNILPATTTVQTKSEGEALTTSPEFANELNSSKGSGQQMDDSTRTEMESKMGADFSGVKIHSGSAASSLNRQVNAQAFTEGSDIYFNEGKYNPESNQGKELLAHELVHTVQQGNGVSRKVMREKNPEDQILDSYAKEIKRILYGPQRALPHFMKHIDPARAIDAWEYMQMMMSEERRIAFSEKYPTLYGDIQFYLPPAYIAQNSSGMQPGVLNSGDEQNALLNWLQQSRTWADPVLLKMVLSMVFQAFDKPGGFGPDKLMPDTRSASEEEKKSVDILKPEEILENIKNGKYDFSHELIYYSARKVEIEILAQHFIVDPNDQQVLNLILGLYSPENPSPESLNDLLQLKYAENKTNTAILDVLHQLSVNEYGYSPEKIMGHEEQKEKGVKTKFKRAHFIGKGLKALNNAKAKKGPVGLSYSSLTRWMPRMFGLNEISVEGFDIEQFQNDIGVSMGGVNFGDGKPGGGALLNFDADFKKGIGHISATSLPFVSIDYLSTDFAFKTDNGYFNGVSSEIKWASSKKDAETGYISIVIDDLQMFNIRSIFDKETYGIGRLQLKGLKANIIHPINKINTLEALQGVFIDSFYYLSKLVTDAIQLSINRFSPTTGQDAKKDLSSLFHDNAKKGEFKPNYENLSLSMTFDSLDIDHVLLIDNDYPAGRTVYPVTNVDQEYIGQIHLGTSELYIDAFARMQADNDRIKETAQKENRPLTPAEQKQVDRNQAALDNYGNGKRKEIEDIDLKISDIKKKAEKENNRDLTDDEKEEIALLETQKLAAQKYLDDPKQGYHLHFETNDVKIAHPEMLNTIVKNLYSPTISGVTANTPEGGNAIEIGNTVFDTNFTEAGVTDTSLVVKDLVLPDLTISSINYVSDDDSTVLTGHDARLLTVSASFTTHFRDPDANDPNKMIDYLDIEKVYIQDASVYGLKLRKETHNKKDDSTRLIQASTPDDKPATILGLVMEGWKLRWDHKDKIKGSMSSDSKASVVHADALTLPKGSDFSSSKQDAGSMIVNALTDVSFMDIDFKAVVDPDSPAYDKTMYSYGFTNASGQLNLINHGMNKKGKTSDASALIDIAGLQLYDGSYYKESESADVISFKLNAINVSSFAYEGEKLKIESDNPTVFDDINFSAHIFYKMENDQRAGSDKVMLDKIFIGEILTNSLNVKVRKDRNSEWSKIPSAALVGKDQSSLKAISVAGLGINSDTGKFIVGKDTLITAGLNANTLPALFIPFLSTYFGEKFAADFSKLKVGTVNIHGNADSNLLTADVKGITIAEMVLNKFKVGTKDQLVIEATGNNPSKITGIEADLSVSFDINQDIKDNVITLNRFFAKKLELYGLKVTIGKDKTIELKPEQKSTIDNFEITGLQLNKSADGKWSTDFTNTVATTGKVDVPDLSAQIGSAFSFESGAEATGITFKGKGKDAFELTIKGPELTNINDKSAVKGSAGGISFGNEGDGPVVKGSALVIKKTGKGAMSYALQAPEITGLKIDLPDKGIHLVIDANIKDGELDVTDGMADFGNREVKATVMTATKDLNVTKVEVTVNDFSKLKNKNSAGSQSVTENPLSFLDTATNSSITLNFLGQTAVVDIKNGKIDLDQAGASLGNALESHVNGIVNIAAGSHADNFFTWVAGYRSHLDPWQQTFVDNYATMRGNAIGRLAHDVIINSQVRLENGVWVLIVSLGDTELRRRELVENSGENYNSITHELLLSKTIIYQKDHPQEQTQAQIDQDHQQLLTDLGIDQAEYDRIGALNFDNPNDENDLIGEMHESGSFPWPDAEGIKTLMTVWLTVNLEPHIKNNLNFSFGADLSGLNAEALGLNLSYSNEKARDSGVGIKIGTSSTPKHIDLQELTIPSLIWINAGKTTKVSIDSANFSSNGIDIDQSSKTKALTTTLNSGKISGLKLYFSKK